MDTILLSTRILVMLFVILMIFVSYINFKRKIITNKELIFWLIFWSLLILIAVVPSILNPFVSAFHFSSRFDLATIAGFMFILALLYYNYSHMRRMENRITKLVSNLAQSDTFMRIERITKEKLERNETKKKEQDIKNEKKTESKSDE
ncbi:MAG: DUF2304 family protein [Nitrospiraceae bacterium]|nr:DUF2304 family protein [Nitrospiraceae bacterium]